MLTSAAILSLPRHPSKAPRTGPYLNPMAKVFRHKSGAGVLRSVPGRAGMKVDGRPPGLKEPKREGVKG